MTVINEVKITWQEVAVACCNNCLRSHMQATKIPQF